jgi:hypothetical protein
MPDGIQQLPRSIFGGRRVQTGDVADDAITAAKIAAGAVGAGELGTAAVTNSKCGFQEVRDIELSFETGEQASHKLFFPFAVTVTAFHLHVSKAVAATDAGAITLLDSAGNSKASQSVPASTVINTEYDPAVTSFTVSAGDFCRINAQKTTAGGKVRGTLTFVRTGA